MNTAKADSVPTHSAMQRQPITVQENETIFDAVDKVCTHHVSALPVVDEGGFLKGLISGSDLLRLIRDELKVPEEDESSTAKLVAKLSEESRARLAETSIASAMRGSVVTAKQKDSLQEIAKLMVIHQIHHIPIVGEGQKLLGLVSSMDLVRIFAEN
ncbi:CBS domain-containing protein [Roseiconus nitratireducens]|nr:CBS domain-containing protein [Roseiconus nitratireducens]